MDNRIIIAAGLGFALVVFVGWLTVRHVRKRRAFKLRQSGRGKGATNIPVE